MINESLKISKETADYLIYGVRTRSYPFEKKVKLNVFLTLYLKMIKFQVKERFQVISGFFFRMKYVNNVFVFFYHSSSDNSVLNTSLRSLSEEYKKVS